MLEDKFKTRLRIAKNKTKSNKDKSQSEPKSSIGQAFKMSTELVSAVAVGTIIGFILDKWFGTKPWLILIFFFCGCCSRYYECDQIRKKITKVNIYGIKSNVPIQCLQNWSRN